MASTVQTIPVACEGGLQLSTPSQTLLGLPGAAIFLENFESSVEGGYRRINGFTKFSTTTPGGVTAVQGIHNYKGGIIIVKAGDIYHTFDGITWTQVNKVTGVTPITKTAIDALSATTRTGNQPAHFQEYDVGIVNESPVITITDGTNKIGFLRIEGTSDATATYLYKELDNATTNAPEDVQQGTIYKDRLVVAKSTSNPAQFWYSARFLVDDFNGISSGTVSTGDPIEAVRSFRDDLIIFCKNSIFKFVNIDGTPSLQPITRNIGCMNGETVQEVGGELVYLAQDGIRVLRGTDRIGDTGLDIISAAVQTTVKRIADRANTFDLRSEVIKTKNQYRLFYSIDGNPATSQESLIVHRQRDATTGEVFWNFSTGKGIEVSAISSGIVNNEENIFHGDFQGNIYNHDDGNDFDGTSIIAEYRTPYFNIGDSGLRKNMHSVTVFNKPEGAANVTMHVRYDFENVETMQPDPYPLGSINAPSLYGSAVYGTSIFGARFIPSEPFAVEGSGKTIQIRFKSEGTDAPYTLQGYDIDFIPAGRI